MNLKKLIFSAAAFAVVGVGASMMMPGKAEALPAFARQTGAACLSCHFQTFPALTAFGRQFMMNSFTDVGDQSLIEDDNLSIPAVLNATFQVRANTTHTSVSNQGSTTTYTVPDKAGIFIAGRVGSNTGVFLMFTGGQNQIGMGSLKGVNMNMGATPIWMVLNSWDVGDFKFGIGAHKSPWGGSNVMEVSNVFGHRGDKLAGQDLSAISNAGFTQMTTGLGTWVGNDMGYLQFSLIAPAIATTGATNVGLTFGKLIRAVATIDLGGWDTLIGVGYVTGSAGKGPATTVTNGELTSVRVPMNLQFIDAQVQGEVGDMSLGVYADWAHAKGKSGPGGAANFYGSGNWVMNTSMGMMGAGNVNSAGRKYDAYSIRAELEPVNRFLIGIGYGYRKLSRQGGDLTSKAYQLAATYKVYQNFDLNLVYNNEKETDAGVSTTTRTTLFEALIMM